MAPWHAEKDLMRDRVSICWNRARRLTCFLSASVTRNELQFGIPTDSSSQRHYRFFPMTSGSRMGWGLTNTPSYRSLDGPQGRLDGCKISRPAGFDLRTVQPLASRYNNTDPNPSLALQTQSVARRVQSATGDSASASVLRYVLAWRSSQILCQPKWKSGP
jgi:hypothetical protein